MLLPSMFCGVGVSLWGAESSQPITGAWCSAVPTAIPGEMPRELFKAAGPQGEFRSAPDHATRCFSALGWIKMTLGSVSPPSWSVKASACEWSGHGAQGSLLWWVQSLPMAGELECHAL